MRVEYDGTPFRGFQIQAGRPDRTVQSQLEETLGKLLGGEVRVQGAGRTDTGVHATGQVIHLRTSSDRSLAYLQHAANRMMHGEIVLRDVQEVDASFDARRSATARTYQYLVYAHPEPPSLLRHYVMHTWRELDLDVMQKAATHLVGRHNFAAFCSEAGHLNHHIRTVRRIQVSRPPATDTWLRAAERLHEGNVFCIEVEAVAFLPHMVRIMAGALVRIGCGQQSPASIPPLLAEGRIGAAGQPAPAHGLCLIHVTYPPPFDRW